MSKTIIVPTVSIVTDSYYPIIDGVARFVDALGMTFHKAGFKVKMIVPNVREKIFDYSSRPFDFIILPTLPIKVKDYFMCLPHPEVQNTIASSDVIIVNSLAFTTAYVLLINHFYKKPVIEFVHTDEREVLHYAGNLPDALNFRIFQSLKYMTSKINYFAVATNKFQKRTLDYGADRRQIFRVPFGYQPQPVNDREITDFQETHGIPRDLPIILYFGRLSDEKNIRRMVKVMGELTLEEDVHGVIAGGGYKQKWVAKEIKRKQYQITLLGRVSDENLPVVYSFADILFSPSFHESLGFTTVEAMNYGVIPAVNGKYRETPLTDDNCLYLRKVRSIDTMKFQLQQLLKDKDRMETMKENALDTSKEFSWKKFSKIWVQKVKYIIERYKKLKELNSQS